MTLSPFVVDSRRGRPLRRRQGTGEKADMPQVGAAARQKYKSSLSRGLLRFP
jgi:hypothetical protein